jgi:hypothetical protein
MDILNETAFLVDIENTPTFLVYDSKTKKFHNVDLLDSDDDGSEDLLTILTAKIGDKIKEIK